MNIDAFNSHSEYERQIELERLLSKKHQLSNKEKELLRNCTSTDYLTQFLIGLLLKETSLLNLSRLIPMALDPHGLEEYKNKAYEIIGDIDLEDVINKIAGIVDETEVESVVYGNVFLCDFIE